MRKENKCQQSEIQKAIRRTDCFLYLTAKLNFCCRVFCFKERNRLTPTHKGGSFGDKFRLLFFDGFALHIHYHSL